MPIMDEPEFTPEQLEEMKKRIIAADPDGIFRGVLGSLHEQERWEVIPFQYRLYSFYHEGQYFTTVTAI